jgi:hypothetical protein
MRRAMRRVQKTRTFYTRPPCTGLGSVYLRGVTKSVTGTIPCQGQLWPFCDKNADLSNSDNDIGTVPVDTDHGVTVGVKAVMADGLQDPPLPEHLLMSLTLSGTIQ